MDVADRAWVRPETSHPVFSTHWANIASVLGILLGLGGTSLLQRRSSHNTLPHQACSGSQVYQGANGVAACDMWLGLQIILVAMLIQNDTLSPYATKRKNKG